MERQALPGGQQAVHLPRGIVACRIQDIAFLAGRQPLHADPEGLRQGRQGARFCPFAFAGLDLVDRARRYADPLRELSLSQFYPFPNRGRLAGDK